jgi:hypothetical protein
MAKLLLNLMSGKVLWRPCVSGEVCKKQGGSHLVHSHGKAAVEIDVWQGLVETLCKWGSVQEGGRVVLVHTHGRAAVEFDV